MKFIHLSQTDSTNSYLVREAASLPSLTLVTAENQTAGRGQRGNSWESEPGKNLTFSLLWKPVAFPVREQFAVSMAAALAICGALAEFGIDAKVKWPNDIYVADDKICGILIEHAVGPQYIMHTIIGAGVNVNQTLFLSDAPNPVSMAMAAGREFGLQQVLAALARHLEEGLAALLIDRNGLKDKFLQMMWRRDGKLHPFSDAATSEHFNAMILDVEDDGRLRLLDECGRLRRYYFKEVVFLRS